MYVGSIYKYLQFFSMILGGLYCVEIEIGSELIGVSNSAKRDRAMQLSSHHPH